MRVFEAGGRRRAAAAKSRAPKLGDRHARGATLPAVQRARGPAAHSPARDLLTTSVAWLTGPTTRPAPGSVMSRAGREAELRVTDPGWRLRDGPRARLLDVDARNVDPPEVDLLADPPKLEDELRACAIDTNPARNPPARDEDAAAREARGEAEIEAQERRDEEQDSSTTSDFEREAQAIAFITLFKLAPALLDAMAGDRDALDLEPHDVPAALRASGDLPLSRRRAPATTDKVPLPGGLRLPMPPTPQQQPELSAPGEGARKKLPPPPVADGVPKVEEMPEAKGAGPGGAAKPEVPAAKGPAPAAPAPDAEQKPAVPVGETARPGKPTEAPSGAAAAHAWAGRVTASTEKIPPPTVPDSAIYRAPIAKAAADPTAVRAAHAKTLFDETKKRLEPGGPPKDLPKIPDEPGLQAEKTVAPAEERPIALASESKQLPDIEASPTGRVPVIGMIVTRHREKDAKTGLTKLVEEIKQVDDKGHVITIPPPSPTSQKEKDKKAIAAKLATPPAKDAAPKPAKGVVVEEKNPPDPPNVPDFAKVDITAVLARLLAEPETYALESVKRARDGYYGLGDKLLEQDISAGLPAKEVGGFSTEIRNIADAAKIKADDLNAKIAARRKEVLEKGLAAKTEIEKQAAKSTQELKKGGQTFADQVQGVRDSLDTWMEDRAAAANGLSKGDVAELRRRKDEYNRQIVDRIGVSRARYEKKGELYKSSFGEEVLKQQNAYEAAALMDKRELEKDTKNPDGTFDAAKLTEAQEKYKPIGMWLKQHQMALDKFNETVGAKIDDKTQDLITALEDAGKAAHDLVTDWFNTMIKYEKSWWEKLVDWVLSWFTTAKKENDGIAAARARENQEALGDQQIFLSLVRNTQGEALTEAQIKDLAGADKEKLAILTTYYLHGHDPVAAVAAGLAERIMGQRQEPLRKAIEEEFIAKGKVEDLLTVSGMQSPPMSRRALEEKATKVSSGFSSGFLGSANDDQVLADMGGMTPVQARAFELIYNERYGRNSDLKGPDLRERMQAKLTPWYDSPSLALMRDVVGAKTYNQQQADALLSGDQDTAAAIALEKAMEDTFFGTGWGTDEDKIFEILRNRSPSEIQAIRRAYKKRYGKDLKVQLHGELKGGATSSHDVEEMHALMSADVNKARAIEADRCAHGTFFGMGWGTDTKGMRDQYDRIKKETEADADRYGMGADWVHEQYLLRTKGMEQAYEDKYGADWAGKTQPGESALHAMQRDELWEWGGELREIEGLHTDDEIKIGAAKVRDQQLSFFHSSEKLLDATTGKYRRRIADARRDGYLQVDVDMDVERRVAASKVRGPNPKTGKLSDAEIAAGYITPTEFATKWGDLDRPSPAALKDRDQRKKQIDAASITNAQKYAKGDLDAMRREFNNAWVTSSYLRDFDGVLRLKAGSWGGKSKEVEALLDNGYLTDAQQFQWAVAGPGTDKEKLKALLKKSKPELQKMADDWAAENPPSELELRLYGHRSNYERFRARALEEFGGPGDPLMDFLFDPTAPLRVQTGQKTKIRGREMFEVADLLDYGEAVTPDEKLKRAERRRDFEEGSTNRWSSDELSIAKKDVETLRGEVAKLATLEAGQPDFRDPKTKLEDILKWNEQVNKQRTTVDETARLADASIEAHRKSVDVVADSAVMIIGVIVAVVVTVVGAIVTAGAATPALAAMWVALAGAVAGGIATIAAKAYLKGNAYGYDEMRNDMIMLVVDSIVAVATAGLGDKLFKAFKASLALETALAERVAQFVAHEAETLAQVLPAAFVTNVLNEDNYRDGNALWNIFSGTMHQTAMGVAQAKIMGLALKPLHGAAERLGKAWARSRLARMPGVRTGVPEMDIIKLRGKPKEREALWREYSAQNPGATKQKFLSDLDILIRERAQSAFEQHERQRAMRKELLEHVPPRQRKALADAPIEVVSEADFKAMTGSDTAQAVTMFRRGKPAILVKEGADLAVLGEEGLHLLQAHDVKTKELVRSLDETKLRNWDKLPVDEQLKLYRNKIALEVDAHQKLVASLERRSASMEPEVAAKRLAEARHTLGELRKRMAEVDAFRPADLAEMTADPAKKPQYLREKPRLFNKKDPKLEPADGADPAASAPKEAAKGKAKAAKAKPETPQEVMQKILAEKDLHEMQLSIMKERESTGTLTPGEKDLLEQLKANPPPKASEARTDHRKMLADELKGLSDKRPDFEGTEVKANDQALPAQRMTRELQPGQTAHQVGEPWMEIRTKRVGPEWVTQPYVYRMVEIRDAADVPVGRFEEVLLRKSGNRWGVHGSAARGAGAVLEKSSLAFSEREYKTGKFREQLPEDAWGKQVKRLQHQVSGKESGFDELLAVFDDPINPKRARLHIVEVKGGGELPGLQKFGAVAENLDKNLNRLEKLLEKPQFLAEHGLTKAHVDAIRAAIAEGRFKIEVRVGPETKLPQALEPTKGAGSKRTTVVDKVEKVANAWRKLRMLESNVMEAGTGKPALEDRAKITELRQKLAEALESGGARRVDKVLKEIAGATSDRGAISRRWGITLDKEPALLERRPTRLDEAPPEPAAAPGQGQGKKPPPDDGGTPPPTAAATAPAATPALAGKRPPATPAIEPTRAPGGEPEPKGGGRKTTPSGPTEPGGTERVRNPGPGGTVLGWGDFDVSTSLQWSKRRFRPLELQQIKRIGRRLEKIPELTPDPAHWSALSPARKQAALRQAVDDVMTIFRIPPSRRPRVEFYNGPPGDYGSASWRFDPLAGGRLKPQTRRGVLSININSSVGDAVVTVVHEGRHYYQSWEAYQQSIGRRAHPFATTWRENLPGSGGDYEYSYQTAKTPAGLVYVLDSFGHKIPNPKYFTQPIERDAESFGRRVADRLPLRWRT